MRGVNDWGIVSFLGLQWDVRKIVRLLDLRFLIQVVEEDSKLNIWLAKINVRKSSFNSDVTSSSS